MTSSHHRSAGPGGRHADGDPEAWDAPWDEGALTVDRAGLREIDRLAVDEFGLPSVVLMENAARGVAGACLERLRESPRSGVVICCGPGNNGGDGFAAARHLHNAGAKVVIVLAADPGDLARDAAMNHAVARRMGIPVARADAAEPRATFDSVADELDAPLVVVDALLGTGLDRPVTGALAEMIASINAARRAGAFVVAVDLPSGMNADTGEPLGAPPDDGVHADVTVTFVGVKPGFWTARARPYLGRVQVVDIGAPAELSRRFARPAPDPGRATPARTGGRR